MNYFIVSILLTLICTYKVTGAPSGLPIQAPAGNETDNANIKYLEYLIKYGYLKNCSLTAQLQHRTISEGDVTSVKNNNNSSNNHNNNNNNNNNITLSPTSNCTTEHVTQAVLLLQAWFQLPETGEFDEATIAKINIRRCGYPDLDPGHIASTYKKPNQQFNEQELEDEEETLQEIVLNQNEPKITQLLNEIAMNLITERKDLIQTRRKRSTIIRTNPSVRFNQKYVRWRLLKNSFSKNIPRYTQLAIVRHAFKMWSRVLPLLFIEDNKGHIRYIDIEVGFGKGTHMDCLKGFDGPGGEVAHSWPGGDIHFDDEEPFSHIGGIGINLLYVALHEIGHVLGLGHNKDTTSIMYSSFTGHQGLFGSKIGTSDRRSAQQIHGVCKGGFDAVFDIMKKNSRNEWVYWTHFVRGDSYWVYDSKNNHPYPNYPKKTEGRWKGMPKAIDAVTQVFYRNRATYRIETELYVFQGEDVYVYDIFIKTYILKTGYPKKIKDVFPAKAGQNETIPSNLDAVYFDFRNWHLYFIKGSWVWEYDISTKGGATGCCESKKPFSEVFPMETTGREPLIGNIDSAYYSYKNDTVFFFKKEHVYQNTVYNSASTTPPIVNKLKHYGVWNEKWYDICDL